MDRLTHIIQKEKDNIINNYDRNWQKMIQDYSTTNKDAFWLTFSASYLFKTNNITWAYDFTSLLHRIGKLHNRNFEKELSELSFLIISHEHIDHCDLQLFTNYHDYLLKLLH